MKIKKGTATIIFEIITYAMLALGAIVCVLPFIIILSGSFTDNATILKEGYSISNRFPCLL